MLLMEKLYEFHAELIAVRERLEKDPRTAAAGHDQLVALLDRQQVEVQRAAGDYGAAMYGRAKYAMAALGDELLLNAQKELWMPQLLEPALFNSQCAGDKIFTDVDAMETATLGDAARDLACVHLAVLGLGFQGRYRHDPDAASRIGRYRQTLFRLAYEDDPLAKRRPGLIAPAAYTSMLAGSLLPSLRRWILAIVLIVVFYAAAGAMIWRFYAADLETPIHDINAGSSR